MPFVSFRSVKYFNAKASFQDKHTIKATAKDGQEVSFGRESIPSVRA
jgi:hypothetical protein